MAKFCSNCGKELVEGVECSCISNTPPVTPIPAQPTQPTQTTSNTPFILGIIGAILMLPGLLCAVTCSGLADYGATTQGHSVGYTFFGFIFGVIPIVAGIIGAIKIKTKPQLSFILFLVSGICALIGWVFTVFTSLFHLAALILFIIAAILLKVQNTKKKLGKEKC